MLAGRSNGTARPLQFSIAVLLVVLTILFQATAIGQSSSRGSHTRSPARTPQYRGDPHQQAPLAFGGYCAVCRRDKTGAEGWVRGNPRFNTVYDGRTYVFPGADQRRRFQQDPGKYIAALGGDCTVTFAETGERVAGKLQFGVDHKHRFYFFASEAQRQAFHANPGAYENADLAHGGYCSVCKVEMGQDVPGNPRYMVTYRGLRYYFPADDQQQLFLQNPDKYAIAPAQTVRGAPRDSKSRAGGSGSR